MRLSEGKIRYLARRTSEWLAGREDVRLLEPPEAVAGEIARVLREEFRREDLLDEEVERLLVRYRPSIDAEGADPARLRQKIRKQLARERGIVL
jgi:hypothetical protein